MATVSGLGSPNWDAEGEAARRLRRQAVFPRPAASVEHAPLPMDREVSVLSAEDVEKLAGISAILSHVRDDAGSIDEIRSCINEMNEGLWRKEGAFFLKAMREETTVEEILSYLSNHIELVQNLELLAIKPNKMLNHKIFLYLQVQTYHAVRTTEMLKKIYLLYAFCSAFEGSIETKVQKAFNEYFEKILDKLSYEEKEKLADVFFQESVPVPYMLGTPITEITLLEGREILSSPSLNRVLQTVIGCTIELPSPPTNPCDVSSLIVDLINNSPCLTKWHLINLHHFSWITELDSAALSRLRYLHIRTHKITDALFDFLSRTPDSCKLELSTDTDEPFLDKLPTHIVKRLKSLDILHNDELNRLLGRAELEELHLNGDWQGLDPKLLGSLKFLYLHGTLMSNQHFLNILTHATSLTTLSIGGDERGCIKGIDFSRMLPHPTLQKVTLDKVNELTESDLGLMIAQLPRLKELNVFSCPKISTEFLASLQDRLATSEGVWLPTL